MSERAPPAPLPLALVGERPLLLIVEDNVVNQKVSRLLMEKRGYQVDVAFDGREAVEATAQKTYVAILMDCHMPRLDGFAATREIRARDAARGSTRVPIIAMTANDGTDAREECLAAGMDDFVAKPVTGDTLDQVLRRWVSKPPPVTTRDSGPIRRPSSPAIDLGMLHGMRAKQAAGEADIVAEVTALFVREAPGRRREMRDAVERGDLALAARIVHTLKGSCGHLGAKTLSMLCGRFEEKVRAGAPFDATFVVGAIAEELDRVCAALATEGGKP